VRCSTWGAEFSEFAIDPLHKDVHKYCNFFYCSIKYSTLSCKYGASLV
jgi:hypothetical protein